MESIFQGWNPLLIYFYLPVRISLFISQFCLGLCWGHDGTHVLAKVPKKHRAAFMGGKHTTTQNVLAAVDFDLRFTYVLAS
jgi:hypothetical protein